MNSFWKLVTSSVGKKLVMGITGTVLFAFVVVHMIGNLQVFLGRDAINHYAEFLQTNAELLWPTRIILAVCVVLHIFTGASLTLENRSKRGVAYDVKKIVGASLVSRTMFISGSIILCFIVYHILHFTTGTTNPEFMALKDAHGRHDVYRIILAGFANPWAAGFYVLGVGLLGFHLSHGVRALCETLGLRLENYAACIDRTAIVVAWILFLGFASVPVAVVLQVVR
ncbi:MAG: succinate dehydrogenase cytochrome b subunit [Verrucomicrobia bacterium]|nr:succinate dehydrogenase cytochrome b subunit [Verrucomicrobiota bacterium]